MRPAIFPFRRPGPIFGKIGVTSSSNPLLLQAKIKVEVGGMVFVDDESAFHGHILTQKPI